MKRKLDQRQFRFESEQIRRLCKVPIIAVYKHPQDYPDKYVARLWDVGRRVTEYVLVGDTLDDVRRGIPDGMQCLPPCPRDNPCLLETWL